MLTASYSANTSAGLETALRDSVRGFGSSPHTTRYLGSVPAAQTELTGMLNSSNESRRSSGSV